MSTLTPEKALAILEAAMGGGMFPQGAIPDSDSGRIEEAEKILLLSRQSKELVDNTGAANVPLWAVVYPVLVTAGEIPEGYVPRVDAEAAGPPASPAPAAPAAQPVAPAPPPSAPAPSPAAVPPPDRQPQGNEVWLDAEGEQWVTLGDYGGGPQIHVRSVATGEETVLPVGFLKQVAPDQSAAQAPAQPATPQVTLLPAGEQREYGGVIYTLEGDEGGENLIILGPDKSRYTQARDGWLTWPKVETPAPEPSTPDPAPPAPVTQPVAEEPPVQQEHPAPETAAVATEAPPSDEPDQSARHEDQMLVVPIDDDEGDEEYAKLLSKVSADYQPKFMPAPMDLERPPTGMPEDLTEIGDIEARRLHGQFNSLGARARYLMGIEQAKARACDRIYKHRLKGAMRDARAALGQGASVTEVQQIAEDNELVAPWLRRREHHHDNAESYKTFVSIYSENVTVLSRDWTMRDREEKQA